MDDERRIAVKGTVFSTWIVLGLFLDGWAHNAGKPEDFWTPWHGVLYSGFIAATITFALDRARRRRAGEPLRTDPLMIAGFVLFAAAGVGDAVWHSLLGVEEDVAALLSPTHLALMIGGLLLIGGPLRNRHHEQRGPAVTWRAGLPDVVALTLSLAVVAFFLQFLSPFHDLEHGDFGIGAPDDQHLYGVASVLVTNVLFLSAAAFALTRRSSLPPGTGTVVLGATAVLLSALDGFAWLVLALPAVAAGIAADVLVHRGASARTVLLTVPAVLWPTWFAVYELREGLGWPAEYWTGVTVLAVLTGWGLALLSAPDDAVRRGGPRPAVHPQEEAQLQPGDRGAPMSVSG